MTLLYTGMQNPEQFIPFLSKFREALGLDQHAGKTQATCLLHNGQDFTIFSLGKIL